MQLVTISSERPLIRLSSPLEPFEKRHLILDVALCQLQRQELLKEPKKRNFQRCIMSEGVEISLQVMVGVLSIVTLIVQFYETLDQNRDNCRTPYRLLLLMALLTVAASSNSIALGVLEFIRGKSKKKTSKAKEASIERSEIIGQVRWSLSQAIHLSASELRNSYLKQCTEAVQKLTPGYMVTHPETADLLILLKDLLSPSEFAKLVPSQHFEENINSERFIHLERDYLVVDIGLSVLQNREPNQKPLKTLYQKIIFWEGTKLVLSLTVNALAIASFAVQIDDTIKEDQKKCQHPPHLMFLLGSNAVLCTLNSLAVGFFEWLKSRSKKQVKKNHKIILETGNSLGKIRLALAKGIHATKPTHRTAFLDECITLIQKLPLSYRENQIEIQQLIEMLTEFLPTEEKLKNLTTKSKLPLKQLEADV